MHVWKESLNKYLLKNIKRVCQEKNKSINRFQSFIFLPNITIDPRIAALGK